MSPSRSITSVRASAEISVCAGCEKPIDPLRAGHVAIVEGGGGFRYFCGVACKTLSVDARSRRGFLDAMTLEAPEVAPNRESGFLPEGSSISRRLDPSPVVSDPENKTVDIPFDALATPVGVSSDSLPASLARVVAPHGVSSRAETQRARSQASPPLEVTEVGVTTLSPPTLRSRALAAERALSPHVEDVEAPVLNGTTRQLDLHASQLLQRRLAQAKRVLPAAGIACGCLAAVIPLAGEAAGSALRLPLAFAAALSLGLHGMIRAREPGEPARWVLLAPVALGAVGASLSHAQGSPHAASHAAYLGVAALVTWLVDIMVGRVLREFDDGYGRLETALACRVRVASEEGTNEVDAAFVEVGDEVLAEAGDVLGVDGNVIAFEAEVIPWLDSQILLEKRKGDAVVAGATVLSGRLLVEATSTRDERAWLRAGRPHGGPGSSVAVAAPMVVRVLRVLVLGMPLAAVLVGSATYAGNEAWPDVVIAASAGAYAVAGFASATAVSMAYAFGLREAQRRGITYRDAAAFDAAARADVAVVCSRGTVLLGAPEIVAVEPLSGLRVSGASSPHGVDAARLLAIAAASLSGSQDSAAEAISRLTPAADVAAEKLRIVRAYDGSGVVAVGVDGTVTTVGTRAFLLEEKISVALADARIRELEAEGRSVLLVALEGRIVGLLASQDALRSGARAAIQRLHDAHIEPIFLSGEARDTCDTIAQALAIEHVRPEILSSRRGDEVRALQEGGHVVAVIGHPSSDESALLAAHVAVVMMAAGATTREWGVALASDDVRDAAHALTIPRVWRDRAKVAALLGAAAQGIVLLGLAFGAAPPMFAPIVAALASVCSMALVRDRGSV